MSPRLNWPDVAFLSLSQTLSIFRTIRQPTDPQRQTMESVRGLGFSVVEAFAVSTPEEEGKQGSGLDPVSAR
jgi:hypothetical protein